MASNSLKQPDVVVMSTVAGRRGFGSGGGHCGLSAGCHLRSTMGLPVLPGTLSGASHDCFTWWNHGNKSVWGNNKPLIKIEEPVDEKMFPGDSC